MNLTKRCRKYHKIMTPMLLLSAVLLSFCISNSHADVAESSLLWPKAPSIDKSLYIRGEDPDTLAPLITFYAPRPLKDKNDPFNLIDPTKTRGLIVHNPSLNVPDVEMRQRFFVFNGVNINGHIGKQQSSIATYRTKAYEYIYNPQFSPDGQKLLYKNGWPFDSGAAFGIYIWNFKDKTIKSVGQSATWTRVQWSPNSRYIAYVTGGDLSGMRKGAEDHINLWAYDTQKEENHLLAKDVAAQIMLADQKHYYVWRPSTYRTFYWTPQETLLYTQQRKTTREERKNGAFEPHRPDIYEVSVPGGASQKLISKGTNPVSSPDGKTIAFFGWSDLVERIVPKEDAKEDEDDVPKVVPPSLYLFNRASKTRTKLADMDKGILVWAPDGKSLYVLHLVDGSKPNTGRIGQLDKIDMSNYKLTTIAQTAAKDADGKPRNYSRFYNLDISRNGKYAILDASYDLGFDRFTETEMKTFLRIDLTTGKVNTIAFCLNKWASVLGWDWYDMSEPAK